MDKYIIVSVKIPQSLYEKIKKYNTKVSQVIRRTLEEEIEKIEEKELASMLDKASLLVLGFLNGLRKNLRNIT